MAEGSDRPPLPQRLRTSAQLLAEGKDTRNFLDAFLTKRAGSVRKLVQIQNFGGVPDLRPFLQTFVKQSGFGAVRRLGIVRDAEAGPAELAFQSVCGALSDAELDAPGRPGEWTRGRVRTGVFILPDNSGPGMLETLLCRTLEPDMKRCIEKFFECAEVSPEGARQDKRRARAFLATRDHPHPSVGVAASKGYWNLEHRLLEPLRAFLTGLGA